MASLREKRKKIEELVFSVLDTLDKLKENSAKYREFFKSMTDDQFKHWADKFFKDPEANFFLEVLPYKNEPNLRDIYKALRILGIPTREKVTFKHLNGVTTSKPVPVGYVFCKRHQQILSKKNSVSESIDHRNPLTGQVTGDSKSARESDLEVYSLRAFGADEVIQELLGPRADNLRAKSEMYEKINSEGMVSLKDLSNNVEDKVTLNTINVMYLGAGMRTNIVRDDLFLPITLERRQKK